MIAERLAGTTLAGAPVNLDALYVELKHRWTLNARPEQLEPLGDWYIWLILAGRGWGKTRTGAETVRKWVEQDGIKRIHLVAPTAADCRDTMVEGPAGILACSHPANRPTYEPSKARVVWPNGAVAHMFSAEEPDRLRGPQCEAWWADEPAAWKRLTDTWDQLQFGARLGDRPRGIATTTPRPLPLIKSLVKRRDVHVTRGKTFDNRRNLAESFIAEMKERYEGTRLGRQELYGEILDDNPNALWKRETLDVARLSAWPAGVSPRRVVVAIDPAATATGDATGIVAAAIGDDGRYYVIDDCTMQGAPVQWARAAVAAFDRHKADRLVSESNQGGDMVAHTLQTVRRDLPLRAVHASRGKAVRAEPIAALYEQGKVSHIGSFPMLEDELCEWSPECKESPNRLDALVWALSDLSRRVEPKVRVYA